MSAVSEIMSQRPLVSANIGTKKFTALDAAKLMVKRKVSSIILFDKSGKPAGIVTERDILKRISALNKRPDEILIEEVMSSPVVAIKPYESIEIASEIMAKRRIKRLVVIEQDGTVVGILSVTDISKRLAKILTDDYNRYGSLRSFLDLVD